MFPCAFDALVYRTIGPSTRSLPAHSRSISRKSNVLFYKRIMYDRRRRHRRRNCHPFFSPAKQELLNRYRCVERRWWIMCCSRSRTKTFCWKIAHSCAICLVDDDEQWTSSEYIHRWMHFNESHFAFVRTVTWIDRSKSVRQKKKKKKSHEISGALCARFTHAIG